jgi:hypothetical protein
MPSIYSLIVPTKVEEKIRYLCRKYPSLEWSGILFYTHIGNFEDGNLVITCEDIYPMDLGTSTFTSYKNDETIAGYIADNIDLFQCDMGLVHSHNQMAAFFSGTDTSTLQSEGNDTNCFVSLIVNNAGTYCAAITRKVQSKKKVITEYLGSFYEFFGDGIKSLTGEDAGRKEEVDTTSIEYFMLDVKREIVDNPFEFLDKRFEEIESKKKEGDEKPYTHNFGKYYKEICDDDLYHWESKKESKSKELSLFDDYQEETTEWKPDAVIIHALVCQIVTCSLIINQNIDLKQWITKYMVKKYNEIFCAEESFDTWCEYIIEFMLNKYDALDKNMPEYDVYNYDSVRNKITEAMTEELDKYPTNHYIESYKEQLTIYS